MTDKRDEFTQDTIRKLGDRVGWLCSNPGCQTPTKGPHTNDDKVVNVGMACHIHAAAPGGPRFDLSQDENERRSIDNGIWLCRCCGMLIDVDEVRFPAALLRRWRREAESLAEERLGKSPIETQVAANVISINQQGGQTAHTINNYIMPARSFNGRTVAGPIVDLLKARTIDTLTINAYNPDAETLEFARHFWDLAVQLGWSVASLPNQIVCPDPWKGIRIESKSAASDSDDPLRVLRDWLIAEGFVVEYRSGADHNQIRVGQRS